MDSWLVVLPPVIAIVLAIWSKQVIISLFAGIWLGSCVLQDGHVLLGLQEALDACIGVFASGGNTKVIIFCVMIGALIALTQRSGGVQGFINWIASKNLIQGKKSAGVGAWLVGILVFIESSITCLVVGSIFRPIFDKLKISREKLAYICDSTSAPVCILIPLNGWGAYIIGLLAAQGVKDPFFVLLNSLFFNWYAIITLFAVLAVVLWEIDFGPMAKAEKRAREENKLFADGAMPMVAEEVIALETKEGIEPKARNMLVPLAIMIIAMPVSLWITGTQEIAKIEKAKIAKVEKGKVEKVEKDKTTYSFIDVLAKGSGSTSVFWSVLAAICTAIVFYMVQGILKLDELMQLSLKGMGGLISLGLIMVMAFAISSVCKKLGTGNYVAGVAKEWLTVSMVPAVLFLVSAFIAFSTGTSWGTFAIMLPIGMPLVGTLDVNMHMVIGAVLGGGIFGDHCSPISDTTLISSMASACDHIDHVNTQLPYALSIGIFTFILYIIAGFLGL